MPRKVNESYTEGDSLKGGYRKRKREIEERLEVLVIPGADASVVAGEIRGWVSGIASY